MKYFFAIVLSIACVASEHETRLGWSSKQLWSPDHCYVLTNIVTADPASTSGGENQLWLIEKNKRSAFCCYLYGRDCAVIWSPDSQRFVINDYSGSSESDCILVTPSFKKGVLNADQESIGEALRRMPVSAGLQRMVHQYVVATRWLDSNTLRLYVSGHAAPDGKQPDSVEWSFDYDVSKKAFTQCEKVEEPASESETIDDSFDKASAKKDER